MAVVKICNKEKAQEYGFCIEGNICYIWEIGNYTMLCLGKVDDTWQADLADRDLNVYQKVNQNFDEIMKECQCLADVAELYQKTYEIIFDEKFAQLMKLFDFHN
jgi:hypothetical protein